ncbi:MAG TPA: hypothetical protein VF017_19965 [Thermoanaerobaculia bacterium]|nr:hypothetical protein [Thermoanaerobaculia bacterium]
MRPFGLVLAALLFVSTAHAEDRRWDLAPLALPPLPSAPAGGPIWPGPVSPIFDNGPLASSLGTGVGGADESILEGITLGMVVLGWGHQLIDQARLADDFVVPPGQLWRVDRVVVFGYQTGSPLTSTFTALNFRIWRGRPGLPGSEVVFGDEVTNRLVSSEWSGVYRVREELAGQVGDRPIMANVGAAGVLLEPAQYWLDFQADGTLTTGPWGPPISRLGATFTGDAMQSNDNGLTWVPIRDFGNDMFQGLPFILEGEAVQSLEVPAVSALGLVVMVIGLAGAGAILSLRRRAGPASPGQ